MAKWLTKVPRRSIGRITFSQDPINGPPPVDILVDIPAFRVRGVDIVDASPGSLSSRQWSVVEQYVVATFIRAPWTGHHFDNIDGDPAVDEVLSRLLDMTRRGKVWKDDDGHISLHIKEINESARRAYDDLRNSGRESPVIRLLLGQEIEPLPRHPYPLDEYRVVMEEVEPEAAHPDLISLCRFLERTTDPRWLSLLIGGWSLEEPSPPRVIRMLASMYSSLTVWFEPDEGQPVFLIATGTGTGGLHGIGTEDQV